LQEKFPDPEVPPRAHAPRDIAIFANMTRSRLLTGVVLTLLGLIAPCSALVSDAELDALLQSSRSSHAAGRGSERDSLIETARTAIRARLAADESAPTALERLDEIERFTSRTDKDRRSALASLKARAQAGDENGVRKAHAEFAKRFPKAALPSLSELLALGAPASPAPQPQLPPSDSCAGTPRGPGCPDTLSASVPPRPTDSAVAPTACPDGPPSAVFLRPNSHQAIVSRDSTLVLQARIHAPCTLRELVLLSDSFPARRVDFPAGRSGTFEFDDAISVPPAAQVLHLVVCDTFGTCARAHLPLRHPARIAPWIPWTSGGLVLLGLITGLVVLLRRPSAAKAPASAHSRGIQMRAAPSPTAADSSIDLQDILRRIMSAAEKEFPRGPRIVSRMNTSIPPLVGNPAELEKAFSHLVRLPLARAGLRGMVLIATGRGPVNMEVVLEDNGPDLEDPALRTLFDSNTARSRDPRASVGRGPHRRGPAPAHPVALAGRRRTARDLPAEMTTPRGSRP
jgi:hypothetical protein